LVARGRRHNQARAHGGCSGVDEVDEVDEVGGREQRRVGAGVQRAANLVEGGVRRRVRWHRIVSLRRHEGWQAGDGAAVSGDVVGRQSGRGRACWGCATFGGEEAGRRIWGGSTGDGGQRSQGGMWDVGCGMWDVGVAPGPAFEARGLRGGGSTVRAGEQRQR
jgi:hypothetical protein